MKELLFEVYCEEIPPSMQEYGARELFNLLQKRFKQRLNKDCCWKEII